MYVLAVELVNATTQLMDCQAPASGDASGYNLVIRTSFRGHTVDAANKMASTCC